MFSDKPNVTVLMPVFDGERFLQESISSILNQTYQDFEFLIINDGSTDSSVNIINFYKNKDSRIKLINNCKNIGLVPTLNQGLKLACGKYIVRMDCDDISLPNRLMSQVKFMEVNPDIVVSGGWIKTIGKPSKTLKYPNDPVTIKAQLIFDCPIAHPTVILRSDIIKNEFSYSEEYSHAEDYDLWIRVSKKFKVANLNQVILRYRRHQNQVTYKYLQQQSSLSLKLRTSLLKELGIILTISEMKLHQEICTFNFQKSREFLDKAHFWLCKLEKANQCSNIYPFDSFQRVLIHKWFQLCLASSSLGFYSWQKYWQSRLSSSGEISLKAISLFAIKCGIKFKHSQT
jgi:glycosyltransferase involved in cell wall biosynthesis